MDASQDHPTTRHGAAPDPGSSTGSAPRHAASADDSTTHLPPADSTQAIPVSDETQAIPAQGGDEPEPWRIGNRYRVEGRIGTGGMADVLRARDELLQRDVAIKVFRTPQPMDTATGVERQQAELHALARLNHPYLITLYDGSITGQDGPAYLVMELIDGPSLADRLKEGPLPDAEARVIGAQVAEGLAYVHAQGMVHRDVKPANILLGHDRSAEGDTVRARLSDFGIVRLLGAESMTSLDATLGTASYLAPEQARGSGVGPAADVYSLGLTLIEAITGLRSFDGPPLEAAVARLTSDPVVPPDLPAPWPSLLHAMTARDPAARPTAGQVAAQLRGTASPFALTGGLPLDSDRTTALPVAAAGAGLAAAAVGASALGTSAFAAQPTGSLPGSVAPAAADARVGGYGAPVGLGAIYDDPPDDAEPERRRSPWPWVIGGLLVVVLLTLGAIALFLSGSPSNSPGSTTPSVAATSKASSSKKAPSKSASRSSSSRPAPSSSQARSTSASRSSSSAPSSTSAAPSTSASSTTRPPISSTPVLSSTPAPPTPSLTSTPAAQPAGPSPTSTSPAAP